MSAVSTAFTGFIGAALTGIIASGAWQRWSEQRQDAADLEGGVLSETAPAAAQLNPLVVPTGKAVRAGVPEGPGIAAASALGGQAHRRHRDR